MTIRFQCPAGHLLRAPDDRAGRRVRCPKCKRTVEVPKQAQQAQAEKAPAKLDAEPRPNISTTRVTQTDAQALVAKVRVKAAAGPSAKIVAQVPDRPSKRSKALPAKPKAKPAVSRSPEPVPVQTPEPKPPPVEAVVCAPAENSRQSSLPPVVPVEVPSSKPMPPVKPVEVKPVEVKPVEVKPVEVKPVEKEPAKTESKRESSRHAGRRDRRRRKRKGESATESVAAKPTSAPPSPDREPPKPSPHRQPKSQRPKPRPKRRTMTDDVYVPDIGHVVAVRWLAFFLSLAVTFSLCPVVYKMQLNPETAQWWARIVLLVAIVQVGFIVWMVNRPDWASVWVVMLVFAAVATLYAMAAAYVLATPIDYPILGGMEHVRNSSKTWCPAVLLVMSLVTYLSGRTSMRWRRAFELQHATVKRSHP